MKNAAKGNVEIRWRDTTVVARFNTFAQACRACVAAHYTDVVLWECTDGRAKTWEPVATFVGA